MYSQQFAGVLAALLVLFFGGSTVYAQDASTHSVGDQAPGVLFAAYPAGTYEGVYFEEFVEPGNSHEFSMVLENASASNINLVIYPADVYSMVNGGMGVEFQDQERSEPANWIDFPEGVVEVPSGEELTKRFTVTVPEGTVPGQYVSAIGVETADSYAVGSEGGSFRQVLRKVVAVVIIVPGEAKPSFALGDPTIETSEGQSVLRLPVENTGNIRVRPVGTVTLADASGKEVAVGDVAMGSVYMGDTAPYELWMPVGLPVGEYHVSADLTDPDTGVSVSREKAPVTLEPEATPAPVMSATPIVAPPVPPADPMTIDDIEISGQADPIQFANVGFEIENTGKHVSRARVSLVVSKDGVIVETYEIDDNLPLPEGSTTVRARYVPPTGWETGTWTFGIEVHSINPNGNVETLLVREEDVATIEVP